MTSKDTEELENSVKSEDSARQALLNYYHSKITSHIGYLITISIGFVALINQNILNILNFFHLDYGDLFIIYIMITFYFIGRIQYWSLLTNASIIVYPYDEKSFKELKKNSFKSDECNLFKYNLLWAFSTASENLVRRLDKYKCHKKSYLSRIASFFSEFNCKIIMLLLTIIFIVVKYFYQFMFSMKI